MEPKIPTDAPTRVLSSKITLLWPHKERKPPTRALLTPKVQTFTKSPSDNLLQSNQFPPSWLRKKSVPKQNVLLRQKKATAANKKAAAAATTTTTTEAETLNNLFQLEDNQLEQNVHHELNLQLRALEMKKAHLANQLATKKRAAEQAQRLTEAKCKVAEMQAEIQKMQEEVEQP
ncbi:hypothetical protein PVAP13_2NG160203 [Panicum virgatum]|uniref:Uncharacterized protein n=1 Tax=Panicum virgatum TaxID=38727 RepID=A0A8T0VPQ6_PANVG|nr:hypothetical protein PVAP13_2NG160203 [Panicum virgatum]